jgi:hypothetical protein
MNFLFAIGVVLVIALAIILIVYGERSVTTHWAFWVGIVIIVVVFVGIPTGFIRLARNF